MEIETLSCKMQNQSFVLSLCYAVTAVSLLVKKTVETLASNENRDKLLFNQNDYAFPSLAAVLYQRHEVE
jgi:hypothetical protein